MDRIKENGKRKEKKSKTKFEKKNTIMNKMEKKNLIANMITIYRWTKKTLNRLYYYYISTVIHTHIELHTELSNSEKVKWDEKKMEKCYFIKQKILFSRV